jgi:hypothetical protein
LCYPHPADEPDDPAPRAPDAMTPSATPTRRTARRRRLTTAPAPADLATVGVPGPVVANLVALGVYTTTLICRAAHPGPKRGATQYADRLHGIVLQTVPFLAEPTGRVLSTIDDIDTERGCMGVRCSSSDCRDAAGRRLITEYRIVSAPSTAP